jgi:hypothetical protein
MGAHADKSAGHFAISMPENKFNLFKRLNENGGLRRAAVADRFCRQAANFAARA